jgi:hypothetical protein
MQPWHLNVAEVRFASLVGVGEVVAVMVTEQIFKMTKIVTPVNNAIESASQSKES